MMTIPRRGRATGARSQRSGRGAGRIRPRLCAGAALALLLSTPTFAANKVIAEAKSPNGVVDVTISLDNDGRAFYAVSRGGHPILNDGKLGFLFTDAPAIQRHLAADGAAHTTHSTTSWEQPFGEWRNIRDDHVELRVPLKETGANPRQLTVVFRIFDDGVGFRYELPDQPALHHANIAEELTQFAFAQPGTAWWKPGFDWNREEYLYNRTSIDAVGTAQTVMTLRLRDGTHVALHEAALVDYAAMDVAKDEGNTLKAVLTPGSGGPKVSRDLPMATPWRTLILADDAAGLYMSHIELNLNAPNALGDVSWIHPGKFAGVWWNMIKGQWTWATGPKHGATTAHVKSYIDFAAANHLQGVLVEGWNVGWDGDWFGNGNAMQFDRPTPDFDADELARYAKAKGVYLIGHNETGGSASHYDSQLDRAFAFARDHGEPVVKTGYVTDAGQIERVDSDGSVHREWHEGQWMANHYLRVVTTAAKYHVGIDSHEPIRDTGLRRTYPSWLSREGGRGMEYNAWIGGKNPPNHEENLVFTQLLGGPMDFTPGMLSLTGVDGSAIQSTMAKQLALYVAIYSPVVMAADTPETYARYPGPTQFIRDVPTDWEDTRVLNGEVGEYATFARRERNGQDWYLGSITNEQPRTLSVRLDFLVPGTTYTAEIDRDGPGATFATDARHSIVIERRPVRSTDTLTLALAPGGGEAIRFVHPGASAKQ